MKKAWMGFLTGTLVLVPCGGIPVEAGERLKKTDGVSANSETRVDGGKIRKRAIRRVRDEVEVDIQVPETRTRVDPITRYVPKTNPKSHPGIPAEGENVAGDTKTVVTLTTQRNEALRATEVIVSTRSWKEVLEQVFVFSSAYWQGAFNLGQFKGTFLDGNWAGGLGTYATNIRPQLAAMFSQMSAEDFGRVVPPDTYMVFTRDARYVAHLPGSYWGNLELHYGEGGNLNIGDTKYSVIASFLFSPLALDLNHDGNINVTGKATGAARFDKNLGFNPEGAVTFDLRGLGKPGRYEWIQPTGDGLLVDDRGGRVSKIAARNGSITGLDLFGGHFDGNGFIKAARLFGSKAKLASLSMPGTLPRPGNVLKGNALSPLKVWIDANHDARVTPDELKTCQALGITEIDLGYHLVGNAAESRMVSTFLQNGEKRLLEDVWFAEGPQP